MSKLLAAAAIGAILSAVTPVPQPQRPQQFVYESQVSLPNGERAGILIPRNPVGIGVQSKSGSRVMVVGDVLTCSPFFETADIFQKNPAGELEPGLESHELLNCGPPAPGQPDRILAIVGIQWRDK